MENVVDTSRAVKEIIEVLHRNRVPIALLDKVFCLVEDDIDTHTVPYSPSLESNTDLAIKETIDNMFKAKRYLEEKSRQEGDGR